MTEELGVGLTYHRALSTFVASNLDAIDVLEVDACSWLERADEEALGILERIPCGKILRGFPVGGSRLPDPARLPRFRDHLAALNARWVTGELAFHRAQAEGREFDTGLSLPLRQTVGGARLAAHSARSIAGELRAPFAVESVKNYLQPRRDEISEGEFLAEVAEDADCGIVLDLGSLSTNARNGRQPVAELLDEIPLGRVWALRLSSAFERKGHVDEIIDMAASLVPRLPGLRAILLDVRPLSQSRLGALGLLEQLPILRSLWAQRRKGGWREPRTRRLGSRWRHERWVTPREWEDALGGLTVGKCVRGPLAEELLRDPGLPVVRELLAELRASRVAKHLPLTSRLITAAAGPAFLRSLLEAYWKRETPSRSAPVEVLGFARHLARLALDIPYLPEVLDYERAVIASYLDGEKRFVRFQHAPEVVLRALAKARFPVPRAKSEASTVR